MSSNGRLPAGIPIIGQAATVKSWCCQVVAQCNCEAKEPVLLVIGLIGVCPSCQRQFQITQVQFNGQTGQVSISIGLVVTQQDAAAFQGARS